MRTLICFIISVIFMTVPAVCLAQSNGDKLFMEGQKYQQTQTVAAQNLAIKKFKAAKVVYTTSDKKTMCDNQIKICNSNITSLKKRTNRISSKKKNKQDTTITDTAQVSVNTIQNKHKNVELSLSENRLDFKYKPKEGATKSVDVKCNYADWEVADKPEWVTVYMAAYKFSVEAQTNDTEDERSGVIKVKCGDKVVDLVVNQAKAGALQKIGKIFKGKK